MIASSTTTCVSHSGTVAVLGDGKRRQILGVGRCGHYGGLLWSQLPVMVAVCSMVLATPHAAPLVFFALGFKV
eukprot:2758041-Amphidinium_carterae.2